MMQLRFAALLMRQWEWHLKNIASPLGKYYEYCIVALRCACGIWLIYRRSLVPIRLRSDVIVAGSSKSVIDRIFEAVSDDPDIEWLAIDATVIRAQAQAGYDRPAYLKR